MSNSTLFVSPAYWLQSPAPTRLGSIAGALRLQVGQWLLQSNVRLLNSDHTGETWLVMSLDAASGVDVPSMSFKTIIAHDGNTAIFRRPRSIWCSGSRTITPR